jgi:hypothetical protein
MEKVAAAVLAVAAPMVTDRRPFGFGRFFHRVIHRVLLLF